MERKLVDIMPPMVDVLAGATKSIRKYHEKNPKAMWAVIGITVISSLVGALLSGWIGILVGLVLGALAYFLGLKAVTKCRDTVERYFRSG